MRDGADSSFSDAAIARVVSARHLACCCAAAFLLPLGLLIFFEAAEPARSSKHGSPKHHRTRAYVTFKHAAVHGPEIDTLFNVSDERSCARRCDAAAPKKCAAFSYTPAKRRCIRHARAQSVRATSDSLASVRDGVSWPPGPAPRVRWSHNATLVLAWSGGDLGWLRRVTDVDIAIIAVERPSNGTHTAAAAKARSQHPEPRELMRFGLRNLKYYASVPFTPQGAHGGGGSSFDSAATALAGVTFITSFYSNLPPLIILADERCGDDSSARASGGCAWLSALYPRAPLAFLPRSTLSAPAVQSQTAITRALKAARTSNGPSEAACLCQLAPPGESVSGVPPRAARWFEMQFLGRSDALGSLPWDRPRRRGVLPPPRRRPQMHSPSDGPLALSAVRVRSRPRASYTALLQLLLVDGKYSYPPIDAHTWARLLHANWLPLVHVDSAGPAEPSRVGWAGLDNGGGVGAWSATGAAARTPPSDPCFDSVSHCGGMLRARLGQPAGGRLRARLKARSEEFFQGARDAARWSIGTVGGHMPERVRGWWRRARDRTGY